MNTDKNNTQLPQSSVKSRFFAQYWNQEVGLQYEGGGSGFTYSINEGTLNDLEIRNDKLVLKSLSKITNEDAEEIQRITGANHLAKQPLIYACLKKSDAIPVIDYLRSKGYAVPFMEYSVDDLISFGWVQLL